MARFIKEIPSLSLSLEKKWVPKNRESTRLEGKISRGETARRTNRGGEKEGNGGEKTDREGGGEEGRQAAMMVRYSLEEYKTRRDIIAPVSRNKTINRRKQLP